MTEENQKRKREKYRVLLEGHTKAQHQHIIVKGKANAINDHGTKGHIKPHQRSHQTSGPGQCSLFNQKKKKLVVGDR